MDAGKVRNGGLRSGGGISLSGKKAVVGWRRWAYIKALTHGLAVLPQVDPELRAKLNAMMIDELRSQLMQFDPETARKIDPKNRRRLVRALEICIATGKRTSEQRGQWAVADSPSGVFVFRDRDELYTRVNNRVEAMFENGVIEEIRAAEAMSSTASKMIGWREIHQLLAAKMSILQCVAAIQQATRRYAKRQLTWFRRQTNFEPLNLSLLTHNEAVKWILLRAQPRKLSGHQND